MSTFFRMRSFPPRVTSGRSFWSCLRTRSVIVVIFCSALANMSSIGRARRAATPADRSGVLCSSIVLRAWAALRTEELSSMTTVFSPSPRDLPRSASRPASTLPPCRWLRSCSPLNVLDKMVVRLWALKLVQLTFAYHYSLLSLLIIKAKLQNQLHNLQL